MTRTITFAFLMTFFFMFSQVKKDYYLIFEPGKVVAPTAVSRQSDNRLSLTFDRHPAFDNFFKNKAVYQYKKAFPTARSASLRRTYLLSLGQAVFLTELMRLPGVSHAELIADEGGLLYEPNDYSITAGNNRALDLVHTAEAFDLTHGSPEILVGVVDDGFDIIHEELQGKIGQYDDNSPHENNHGTRVAGFIAADTGNAIGVSSIGFNTRLVLSGNFDSAATRNEEMFRLSQIPGVRVLNGSWYNGCSYSQVEDALYQSINDRGVVVVFAAGNGGQCGGPTNYLYPASYDSVIAVSSVGCSFPYGTDHAVYGEIEWEDSHQNTNDDPDSTHQHHDKVDLVAPGYAVPGAISAGNAYGKAWGTSYAAPQVAATCALILSVNPLLTAAQVRNILLDTTDDIYHLPANQPYTGMLGTGRLNVYRAVKTAKCLYENVADAPLDLYIRNSGSDLGLEPDNTTETTWNSTDIWVRNQPDGHYIREHQAPIYNPEEASYVYVRVRNTSCKNSSGNEELNLYWSKSNTPLTWPQYWNGALSLNTEVPIGNKISTLAIPVLAPGQETILSFEWNVPNPSDYLGISNPDNFCLLARVVASGDSMTFQEGTLIAENVRNNNNIAWKNIAVGADSFENVNPLSYDEPALLLSPFKISRLSSNPAGDQIRVDYGVYGASSALLMLTNLGSGVYQKYPLNPYKTTISIDLSNYGSGVYGLSLICNEQPVDFKKLLVK